MEVNHFTEFMDVCKNKHFGLKYINFIIACRIKNQNLDPTTYTENHHILSKSIFPQYKNLSTHKWNSVHLTFRQHVDAHLILHYAIGGMLSVAAYNMLFMCNTEIDFLEFKRILPSRMRIKYQALLKEARSSEQRGKSNYIDPITKIKYNLISVNDPRIKELGLVHPTQDKIFCYLPDGTWYGRLHKEDPRIKELGMIHYIKTPERVEQLKRFSDGATKANLGTTVYNNGTIAKKFKEGDVIPAGFVVGALPRPSRQGKAHPKKPATPYPSKETVIKDMQTMTLVQCHNKYDMCGPTFDKLLLQYDIKWIKKTKKAQVIDLSNDEIHLDMQSKQSMEDCAQSRNISITAYRKKLREYDIKWIRSAEPWNKGIIYPSVIHQRNNGTMTLAQCAIELGVSTSKLETTIYHHQIKWIKKNPNECRRNTISTVD